MPSHIKVLITASIYFIGLISFEAAQQQFYISWFNLEGNGEVTFFTLFQSQAIRWVVWAFFALPLGYYIYKHPFNKISIKVVQHYCILLVASLLLTLLVISIVQIVRDQTSLSSFGEYFSFYFYQKAALFVNAYLGLIVSITLYKNLKLLDSKVIELSDLRTEFNSVYNELIQKNKDDKTPVIQIKIGNKIKNILLSDVIWIQSDDYCVKIHTENGSYNLRKSMKYMEQELSSKGFIRVHRNSIVNAESIDVLDFSNEPYVKLKNGEIILIAVSRVPKVKKLLKEEGLPA